MVNARFTRVSLILVLALLSAAVGPVPVPSYAQDPQPPPPRQISPANADDARPLVELNGPTGSPRVDILGDGRRRVVQGAPQSPARTLSPQQCSGELKELVRNGGFEEDTDSWYETHTAGSVLYDSAVYYAGTRSLKMASDADADMWAWETMDIPSQVEDATLSFYLRQDIIDPDDQLYAIFYDETMTDILSWGLVTYSGPAASWELITFDMNSVLEYLVGRTVRLTFYVFTDGIDHTVYHIDEVSVVACVPPPWCTEALTNGDLETGSLTPWESTGAVSLVSDYVHAGSYAAKIGESTANLAGSGPNLSIQSAPVSRPLPGDVAPSRMSAARDARAQRAARDDALPVADSPASSAPAGQAVAAPPSLENAVLTTGPLPPEALAAPHSPSAAMPGSRNVKLDSAMDSLADAARVSVAEAVDLAQSQSLRLSGSRVHAQIVVPASSSANVIAMVNQVGGEVTGVGNGDTLIQGWLPVEALETLAAQDDVYVIRRPATAISLSGANAINATTEGLAAMNALAWHGAGHDGTGVKIGIIDIGFLGYTGLLGSELPASVTVKNFVDGETDPQVDGTSPFGTANVEVIHDVAPGASLYLAKISTNIDLAEAVAWLKDTHAVDIISTSFYWQNQTPGDGTGEFADLVASARSAGILWITSAGNDRVNHWGGLYSDGDADNYHQFSGDQEINYFGPGDTTAYYISAGRSFHVFLRWNDWTNVDQDYDLYLVRWNGTSWDTIASSTDPQDGSPGQTPTEYAFATTSGTDTFYGFIIERFSSNQTVNFEVFAPDWNYRLDEILHARSIGNLADVPDAMTVAAVDVTSPYDQEWYSAEGPINGPGGGVTGAIIAKPDIAAYANVSTEMYGVENLAGTGAATPHVSGAAALVLGANPAYTPNDVQAFLEGRAVDMGSAGLDLQYGHGRLHLGAPPSSGSDASQLWQTFTFPADGRSLALSYWLRAEATPDPNDSFFVLLYNHDFSELLWWDVPSYEAGSWKLKESTIRAYPEWAGQDLNLLFWTDNDGLGAESAFWVDDVSLGICPEGPSVSNAYVRADVGGDNGLFVIGTTGGDPTTLSDDDKNLLYGFTEGGYSFPWSSFPTLRIISGTEPLTETFYYFLDLIPPIQPPTPDGNSVVTQWWVDGIEVAQRISLAESPFTGQDDTVLIEYELLNWNSDERAVGLRSVLDVKVGDNDGAPYFVPGYGDVTHETEFMGEDVPVYWKAFESEDLDPAFLKGQGILLGGEATPPDRFLIAQWFPLWLTAWDYTISASEVVTGDSAVAVYWDPVELYYGEQTYFATYYGLAGEGGGDTWLDAPGEISCEEREFEVVLWVVNNTVFALTGGQSTLTLPSGLDLVSGEATTKAWSDIPPGEAASVSWLVAASGAADATVTVQTSTSFAGGANYTPDPFDITVPLCEAGPLQAPTGLTADPGRQSIELSWEPSPSLGVEGYNVYRSESSGGPFAQVNAALANTAFYQDADPALITGTTYYYGVTSVAGADESQRSETANATFGTLELLIPDSHGPRDATVVLPINIANASGLEMDSMDVRLTYPTETLRLVPGGVQRTPLSENFVFGVNETQSGTVQILLAADVETLWGEGTLFQLLFEVVGPEGTEGPLEFDDAGTEIWSVDDDVSPVPLTLRDGTFQVQRNFGLGDLNGDGKVSSKDVTLAMRIAVGKSTPDAEQQAAGDVNGDGRVNSADTALIIRIALGMDTVPTRRNRIATRARVGSELTVSLGSLDGSPGSTVRVPIDVSDAAQIAGADLTVNYDANVVEVVGVELDSWVQGNSFRLETNINDNTDEVSTPGQLRISLAQLQDSTHQGLPGGGGERTLLEVEFAIKRSAQDGDTPLTLSNVRLNDPYGRDFVSSALQNTVSAGSGQITIGERQIYLPLVLRNG